MGKIPQRGLNTGDKITALGFGTWQLDEGDETEKAVSDALEAGYRLIDTAKIYGNERSVGQAIRSSKVKRQDVFLTTKLWPSDFGYQEALDAFEGSLRRLNQDFVDLYLLHWPGSNIDARHEAWQALVEIQNAGQAKNIGVSNFDVEDLKNLEAASDVVPAVNQIEFHPFIYHKQVEILEYCKSKGIVVEAYSPLGRARHLDHPALGLVAEKHRKTPAQVMLRWAYQHQTVAIPKSSHKQRIQENLQIFDFELSQKEMDALDELGGGRSSLPLIARLLK